MKKRAERADGFTIIPDVIRLNRELSSTALRVYLVLSAEARDKKGQACGAMGLRLIARLGCCSVPAVVAAMKDLCNRGYVVKSGGVRERTRYMLTSKWHIPAAQRPGWKKPEEETIWQDEAVKVVRKKRAREKYEPQRYDLKEESA